MWGTCCGRIELPDPVVERLSQGAVPQAPTLREMRGDDGSRFAVLDLILEVPAEYLRDLDQEHRVLGFDWGVRSLITVSILEKPERDAEEKYRQISRPVFLDSGGRRWTPAQPQPRVSPIHPGPPTLCKPATSAG